MRSKLLALIYKDCLLLVRDRAGLCMMFLMPMLLAVVMTYLQDSTFNSINETRIPLLLLNSDRDSLGIAMERQLEQAGIFDIRKEWGGRQPDRDELVQAVARGDFMIGIVIPPKATATIRAKVRQYVAAAFNGGQTATAAADSLRVEIFIDPVAKASFRSTLMSALREQAARMESDFVTKAVVAEVNRFFPIAAPDISISRDLITFAEQYALPKEDTAIPNSTQHNIPAWSMFAVFFIAISLSGNIIREREDGSYVRLLAMPCPARLYILSKAAVYILVCMMQYAALFLIGIALFPLIGLPALAVAGHWTLAFIVGLCSALAAICYGAAIGRIARTQQQAAIFAAVSTVIMAAIGGVWIPVFVMPPFMKYVSALSPLNWGLEGFYDVLIRNGNLLSILPECAASLGFAAVCAFVAAKRRAIEN